MDRSHYNYQDNRDVNQMYEYLESRIKALKERLSAVEMENATLKGQIIENSQKTTARKRTQTPLVLTNNPVRN